MRINRPILGQLILMHPPFCERCPVSAVATAAPPLWLPAMALLALGEDKEDRAPATRVARQSAIFR
jgi:hypothetical protein